MYMCDLKKVNALTRDEALAQANEYFKGKKEFVTLVDRSIE